MMGFSNGSDLSFGQGFPLRIGGSFEGLMLLYYRQWGIHVFVEKATTYQ
jgi:hypothetical protein